jgi:nucleotide-binding universal stress UspA family protein
MVTISDISSHTDPALGAPVLACLDFSEDSKSALIWACKFAESNGIPLVLLHVVHDIAAHPGFYKMKKSGKSEPMLDIAESMLDEFLDQVRSQHPELEVLHNADVQLVPGLPPTRIIEVAGLLNASLIVIGGRGMTGHLFRRLGTVVERVAELSRIPVVIVKSEGGGTLSKKEIKKLKKQQKKERERLKNLLGIGGEETGDNGK